MNSKTYKTKRGNGPGGRFPVSLRTKDKKLEVYTPRTIPLQQMATQKVVYLIGSIGSIINISAVKIGDTIPGKEHPLGLKMFSR